MDGDLKGRVCIVTGASRGIGSAIAIKLAGQGCKVVVNFRSRSDKAQETAEKVLAAGGEALLAQADVSNTESVTAMFKKVVECWSKVDVLVNNAGVTADNLLLRMTDEAWDDVMATNLRGAFLCTRQALRSMLRQDWGRIINITSIAGLMGNIGQCNYAASKSGLIGLTKSIAKEVGSHNITVNAIAPGFITTEMTSRLAEKNLDAVLSRVPLKRLGSPQDVADTALFLCSRGGSYITGQVITVDGGVSIS
jgi:3-oxoacyl-[acyl-carrier protein] reductase